MKYSRSARHVVSARTASLIAIAAAAVPFVVSTARAGYTSTDTFVGVTATTPPGSSAGFADPTQWTAASGTQALPTASQLAVLTGFSTTATLTATSMVMYGMSTNATGNNIIRPVGGGTITLVSTDITSDGVSQAPAIQAFGDPASTTASSTAIDMFVPLILGNAASTSLQVATFDNTANNSAITTEGKISEFPGSTWGLNITGGVPGAGTGKQIQFKGTNYFTAGFAYSGDTTIAAGGQLRIFNNLIPHYAGRGNLVLNGTLSMSINTQAMIVNALNGGLTVTSTGTVTGILNRQSGTAVFAFGAGDANGQYDGQAQTAVSLVKVGAGTETLTNATSTNNAPVLLQGGILNVTSIGTSGTGSASALGAGITAGSLVLDGGTLKYSGAGNTTDRLFTVAAAGGAIDSSGTGPLVWNNATGAAVLTDVINRIAEVQTGTAATLPIKMPGTNGLFPGMVVTGGNSLFPANTTIISVDSPTQITVSANRTFAVASGTGAENLTFAPQTLDRTLTLSGTNAGLNSMAMQFVDSPGGGKLAIVKSGTGTWALSGANTYTGTTTVSGGALILSGSAAAAPILTGGGTNLNGGELVFDYTGQDSLSATINALISASAASASGFTTGQFRSSLAAGDPSHLIAVGNVEASDLGITLGGTALAHAIVVKATYVGDSSLDGKVDLGNDFNLFLQGFLHHASTWEFGDYNYDGNVNTTDFGLFVDGFKGQGGALGDLDGIIESSSLLSTAQKATLLAAVPEPSLVGASVITAAGMLMRRRKR